MRGVFVARLRRVAAEAARLASDGDPAQALFTFLRQSVDQAELQNALAGMLADADADADGDVGAAAAEVRGELVAALGALLTAAQEAGAARRDLEVPDLIGPLAGASRAIEYAGTDAPARAP